MRVPAAQMRIRRLAGAGIALLIAALPAGAQATDDTWLGSTMVKVTGSPLELGVGENASLHANLDGSGGSDIFWFDEAGLTLAVGENGGTRTYGTVAIEGDELKVLSLPAASGSGTSSDPWTVMSAWDAGGRFRVEQIVRYTEGSQRFHVAYSVRNVTGGSLSFRPYLSTEVAGDFSVPLARRNATVPGSVGLVVPLDGGTRDPNDPVFDGYSFGRATELEPDPSTPWVSAVSGDGQDARLAISQAQPLPSSLPVRARWQPLLAADWGSQTLAAGAAYSFGATIKHASALRTVPLITGTPNDQPFTLQVRTDTADGGPLAGRRLGWIADGYSRELSGTMTTDADGRASLTWTADGQQTDRVIVWIDTDGDGAWDRDTETTRQSMISWVDSSGNAAGGVDTPGSGMDGSDVVASGGGVTGVAIGAGAEPLPAGTSPVTPSRATLRLSQVVLERVQARVVRVTGRTSAQLGKRLTIALRNRRGKLLARTTAPVRRGRFAVQMKLKNVARRGRYRLSIRYAGDDRIAPLARTHLLALRR
ncbi:MAG TPA: hypothetical protein VF066_02760 [Thermoleophilaceae bacterium]